jgi:hypothetical protein
MIRRLLGLVLLTALFSAHAFAQDPTITATLSSTTCPGTGCVSLSALNNRSMATVEVSGGAWTGALLVEISSSSQSVPVFAAGSKTQAESITANGVYQVPMAGASAIRVRASVLSLGTPAVKLSAGQGSADFTLPVGAATAAKQDTGNASVASIDGKVVTVNTGAVVVASSALPAGAATSAAQGTGNASIASIDGKITAVDTGAVVVSSSALPSGAATSALQTSGNVSLSSIDGKTPALGQAAMAASVPVAIASNQGAVPVSGTVTANAGTGTFAVSASSLPLPTGAATEATLSALNGKVTAVDTGAVVVASSALPAGASTSAKQPAFGTAGAPSTDVLTVQGRASMTPLLVDGSGVTQPVTAAALPLPAGASTSALQTSGNSSLSSIDTKTPALGQALSGASVPVVLPAAQITTLTPPAAIVGFALDATLTGGTQKTKIVDSGGTNAAIVSAGGAVKVDGSAVTQPVNVSFSALPSGAATETTLSSVWSAVGITSLAAGNFGSGVPGVGLAIAVDNGSGLLVSPMATTSAPAGTESALVVRNIPSGTQPVSIATLPALTEGSAVIGHVIADSGSTTDVTQATAANLNVRAAQGAPAAAANRWPVAVSDGTNSMPTMDAVARAGFHKITDGTNTASVKGASTLPALTDVAVVTTQRDPLPAGTNVIGHVINDAGSAVIGHVIADSGSTTVVTGTVTVSTHDVGSITTAVVPGTGATNLGKAEDATHTSGDIGVMAMGIRKDTNAQTTNADGDYTPGSFDAYGAQFTRVDHPNRIRCTVTVSTATAITALGGSCQAPGAGLSIYITDIEFSSSAAGIAADAFPTLKYGTGGTCGTGTTVFWGALSAAAIRAEKSYATPIKIPANNEVCWITSTAGSKFIVVTGFIAP